VANSGFGHPQIEELNKAFVPFGVPDLLLCVGSMALEKEARM
jgi:hypothetical protein